MIYSGWESAYQHVICRDNISNMADFQNDSHQITKSPEIHKMSYRGNYST